MSIRLFELGEERARVLVIDDFVEDPGLLIAQAAMLAPFPEVEGNYYPGTRRLIDPDKDDVYSYVDLACRGLNPLLAEIWNVKKFSVDEAGFSMVTRRPDTIRPIQRIPHYDSLDPGYFAVLHYLSKPPRGGTGFYRHRRTGFAQLSQERYDTFAEAFEEDIREYGTPPLEYVNETTPAWEKIGEVEGLYNRCVIYQGSMFHSGLIPPDFNFTTDVWSGRLTANIFLKATFA